MIGPPSVLAWTTTAKQNARLLAVAHQRKARVGLEQSDQSYCVGLRQTHTRSSLLSSPSIDHNDNNPAGQNCSAWDDAVQRVKFAEGWDISEIQRKLVEKGLNYYYSNNSSSRKPRNNLNTSTTATASTVSSEWRRVPGCTATVEIQTTITNLHSEETTRRRNSTTNGVISVQGTADAHVSRGLLALVCELLEGLSTETVLSLPIQNGEGELAQSLGISQALSRGRNNGFENMLRTVQNQIRDTLLRTERYSNRAAKKIDATVYANTDNVQNHPTVALLLSGGVDSSVALKLLLQQGYNVTCFYLKIWLEDELAHLGECPWQDDYETCQAVCAHLGGVPLETVSLQQEYLQHVIQYTVQTAQQGRTPNPDIWCNSRIKFGCFYEAIAPRHFDYIATGHYAQLVRNSGDDDSDTSIRLLRAPDPVKDQSYFLCALTQKQLLRVLFPIGHLEKHEVRQIAMDCQLPNRNRPDSQGLCFLGKVRFDDFLRAYLGEQAGPIVDAVTGQVLGQHKGLWYHTVGQRKGIGKVLEPRATARGPWYVVAKDVPNNTLYCSNQYDDFAETARSHFAVELIEWINGDVVAASSAEEGAYDSDKKVAYPILRKDLTMKIRHGPKLVSGSVEQTSPSTANVDLDAPDSGLAPGQYVVFYSQQECLGGGVISERHWNRFLQNNKSNNYTNLSQT